MLLKNSSLSDLTEKLRVPTTFSSKSNVYASGLCLKDGVLIGCKFYSKLYLKSDMYSEYLFNFGGQICLDHYNLDNSEWTKCYPGFSGFSLGTEILGSKIRKGFGYKIIENGELKFKVYYLDDKNQINEQESYKYAPRAQFAPAKEFPKFECDLVEVSETKRGKWAFCPKIDYPNIPSLEYDISTCLDMENLAVFNYIKALNKYYVLNFGSNPKYEKIYLVGKDNRNLNLLIDLVKDLEYNFSNEK